jgi:tetratricopeptide (TPR) repeat protein
MRRSCLAGLAVALLSPGAAAASVVVYGHSLAEACYHSSLLKAGTSQALNECNRALAEEPLSLHDRVATFVNRGIVRVHIGDTKAADRDFDHAILLDPAEPDSYLNKGLLRLRADRSAEAMPLIDEAIAKGTTMPALAHYARGLAFERLGNVKAAYADLQRARALDPGWRLPAEQLVRFQVRPK